MCWNEVIFPVGELYVPYVQKSGPQWATMGHGGPPWAMVGHGGPRWVMPCMFSNLVFCIEGTLPGNMLVTYGVV